MLILNLQKPFMCIFLKAFSSRFSFAKISQRLFEVTYANIFKKELLGQPETTVKQFLVKWLDVSKIGKILTNLKLNKMRSLFFLIVPLLMHISKEC